jgi:ribosomal protein S1
MMRTILVGMAALLVAAGSIATAHEQSLHKGRATGGTVVSISERGLMLESAAGNVPVILSETTKFERADKPVTKQEIRKGDHVDVFGTKLETGELVAKEVIVHGPEAPEHEGGAVHHGQ